MCAQTVLEAGLEREGRPFKWVRINSETIGQGEAILDIRAAINTWQHAHSSADYFQRPRVLIEGSGAALSQNTVGNSNTAVGDTALVNLFPHFREQWVCYLHHFQNCFLSAPKGSFQFWLRSP